MNSKFYKYCAVPWCHNTTVKTPQKLFIYVPSQKERRKHWFQLARRYRAPSAKNVYFCEDHFDLPNDMENFMEYHITGSVSQIRMKPDCFPTKFDCQSNKKRTSDISSPSTNKRLRKALNEECLKDEDRNVGLVIQNGNKENERPTRCTDFQQAKGNIQEVTSKTLDKLSSSLYEAREHLKININKTNFLHKLHNLQPNQKQVGN